MTELTADQIAAVLELQPDPAGGRWRETFRDEHAVTGFRLLAAGETLAWARLSESVEVWQFYDGAPLRLTLAAIEGGEAVSLTLSRDAGDRAQAGVPEGWWRSAESSGAWSLLGVTTTSPFELPDSLAP